MDYKKYLLRNLLIRYEGSQAFKAGNYSRRVIIRLQEEHRINEQLEDIDEKQAFLRSLQELKETAVIDYSWVKYEEGNLVDRIWLNFEQIPKAYQLAEMVSLATVLEQCLQAINSSVSVVRAEWACDYLEQQRERVIDKKLLPRTYKRGSVKVFYDLLKLLEGLEQAPAGQLERVFSRRVFGDSKYFEKHLKSKLLSILRDYYGEERENEELMQIAGLSRYPEIMEFTGDITVKASSGEIEYRLQPYGAYINSFLINDILEIDIEMINHILFIENKANYVWYVMNRKQDDELVILHGGYYSKAKGEWFRKLIAAAQKCEEKGRPLTYQHWGDMDLGGMQIFERLKDNLVKNLKPYLMDVETYYLYQKTGRKIKDKKYYEKLEGYLMNTKVTEFIELTREILKSGRVVEQEVIIEDYN